MEKAALVKQNKTKDVVIELQQNKICGQKQTVRHPKHINPEAATSIMNVRLHFSF